MGAPIPSQEELADLSKACQRVWDLDTNRLEPDRDYQINLQVRFCNRKLYLGT